MQSFRNNQGRFVTGLKGSKPRGAINNNTRHYLARIDKVSQLLESNRGDNIGCLSKKDQVMLWLEIQKMIHVKLAKFTEPDPAKERINKITFQYVGADGKPIDGHPDFPATPPKGVTAPLQPGQVPPANSTSEHYDAIDLGRVGRQGYFRRSNSI